MPTELAGIGDLDGQVVHVLNGGNCTAAHVTHGGVQRRDGAVHRGGQGAVIQCGLQAGQGVVLALGLLKLRLGVVHTAGRASGSLLVGLLGLVQRLGQLLDLVVALADGVKALQAQFRDAALALGDALTVGVIVDLPLQTRGAVGIAVLLGLGQLDAQVRQGVFVPGNFLSVAGVILGDDLTVRLAAVAAVGH